MKYIDFAENESLSTIVLGMMRISELSEDEVEALVEAALSIGTNTFDLADIYGNGQCEQLLGKVRDQMWIQSKCGIRKDGFTYFDFSKDYILDSVDGILERLQIERLDSLLLHRPDALMEPEEVAAAFNHLEQAGKVRHFGVSNQNPMMMELLKTAVKQPLKVNQLQLSAAFTPSFEAGFHVNMEGPKAAVRDGSVFEYCRLTDTVIQAWSVLQHGYFKGNFVGKEEFAALNHVLTDLAKKYQVTPTAIALAWVLRYPGKVQAVIGTTKPKHVLEAGKAATVTLTRKEWYQIYLATGNDLP